MGCSLPWMRVELSMTALPAMGIQSDKVGTRPGKHTKSDMEHGHL